MKFKQSKLDFDLTGRLTQEATQSFLSRNPCDVSDSFHSACVFIKPFLFQRPFKLVDHYWHRGGAEDSVPSWSEPSITATGSFLETHKYTDAHRAMMQNNPHLTHINQCQQSESLPRLPVRTGCRWRNGHKVWNTNETLCLTYWKKTHLGVCLFCGLLLKKKSVSPSLSSSSASSSHFCYSSRHSSHPSRCLCSVTFRGADE